MTVAAPAVTAALPGGGYDPLNWPGEALGAAGSAAGSVASSAASSVWGDVEPFLAEAMLVVFGLGLMALGAFKIASPSSSIKDALAGIGKTAATAATEAPEAAAAA